MLARPPDRYCGGPYFGPLPIFGAGAGCELGAGGGLLILGALAGALGLDVGVGREPCEPRPIPASPPRADGVIAGALAGA
jgi:hypothetical protein